MQIKVSIGKEKQDFREDIFEKQEKKDEKYFFLSKI